MNKIHYIPFCGSYPQIKTSFRILPCNSDPEQSVEQNSFCRTDDGLCSTPSGKNFQRHNPPTVCFFKCRLLFFTSSHINSLTFHSCHGGSCTKTTRAAGGRGHQREKEKRKMPDHKKKIHFHTHPPL